ncbi:cytochrome c-550 PedF [Azoarcus sp. TTM-91]|uniref:cytochrome c-550 PedF n=1 Tax=Azoarcus sp. TTM-91 TaxID=2691581 RepID=UPI00145F30FD|nr:cytochrome c-550 PedF [Azoarcus sp. TTM-91]NMG37432.1 cytochrome c-550 PedF [Azoarcus sp. TTM-91]
MSPTLNARRTPATLSAADGPRRLLLHLAALLLQIALLAGFVSPARAEVAIPPVVDISPLPPLGETWLAANPYRGNPQAVEIGRSAYNQSCARCHGVDADHQGNAADLRRVDAYCRRIADTGLRAACMLDNDAFFKESVLHGKVRVGVVHMPPWEGLLSQEVVWAIQTFVESRAGSVK